jgi:hypothetical protein
MFSSALPSSISLATVTPSLVMVGDDDVASLGAEGDLHRISQNVDATQDCLTGIFSMQNLLCHMCCSCYRLIGPINFLLRNL